MGGRIIGDDMCGGCGKRVYAAEQVSVEAVYKAVSRG